MRQIIKDQNKIFKTFNDECQPYINKVVFATDKSSDFSRLDYCLTGEFLGFYSAEAPFRVKVGTHILAFKYMSPIDNVKDAEIDFKPYDLETFLKYHEVGDTIYIREKTNRDVILCRLFIGYDKPAENSQFKEIVILGGCFYSFEELFTDFEICEQGKWLPFGVEK